MKIFILEHLCFIVWKLSHSCKSGTEILTFYGERFAVVLDRICNQIKTLITVNVSTVCSTSLSSAFKTSLEVARNLTLLHCLHSPKGMSEGYFEEF